MPIYEFYCPHCNTIYNFLSRSINTEKVPACPTCLKESLTRKISLFATVTHKGSGDNENSAGNDSANLPIDESRITKAMESLSAEAEHITDDDPRQAAQLLRKFSDMTGIRYQGKMAEALDKLEAGEDPEALEAEMGNDFENEEMPFIIEGQNPISKNRATAPQRDDTLYEM
jgi:putative FmdB family regulatory protein